MSFSPKWYIKHRDGRKWTKEELGHCVKWDYHNPWNRVTDKNYNSWGVSIDMYGRVILTDTGGHNHRVQDDDMIVVFNV